MSDNETGPINMGWNYNELPAGLEPKDTSQVVMRRSTSRRRILGAFGLGVAAGVAGLGTAAFVADRLGLLGWVPDSHVRQGKDGPRIYPEWSTQAFDGDMSKWPRFEGVASANLIDRSDWPACFMSTPREAFENQRRRYNRAYDAVAWNPDENEIHIATLPGGRPFLTPLHTDKDNLVVGMTLGPGELRATPGLWLAESRLFVPAAAGAIALPQRIEQDNVARDMPGVVYM